MLLATFMLGSACAERIANKVTIRKEDHGILVNGKPFFPIGAYRTQQHIKDESGKALKAVRKMGFNTIFFHGGIDSEPELDRVAKAGLYVWWRHNLMYSAPQLKELIKKFRSHPALLFWEMDDEPVVNQFDYKKCAMSYKTLKKADPYHPLLIVDYPYFDVPKRNRQLKKWTKICDIYCFDHYPVALRRWEPWLPNMPKDWPYSIAIIGVLVDYWQSLAPGKPVFVVLQAFSDTGKEGYPSYIQSRFMAYNAVIHGANGLFYWPGPPMSTLSRPAPTGEHQEDDSVRFWSYLQLVTKELAEMAPVFAAPDAKWKPEVGILGDSLVKQKEIECKVKQVGDTAVILMTNISDFPAQIKVTAPEFAGTEARENVQCWYEPHMLAVDEKGVFSDRIDPYEVKIYSIAPQAEMLKRIAQRKK